VPGPQAPLYLAGARLLTLYPVSIPTHGIALNLTVQSYCGALDFGLTACRRTVPELAKLAGYLEESLLELHEAVMAMAESPAAAVPAAVKRARPKAVRAPAPVKAAVPARKRKPVLAKAGRVAKSAKASRP